MSSQDTLVVRPVCRRGALTGEFRSDATRKIYPSLDALVKAEVEISDAPSRRTTTRRRTATPAQAKHLGWIYGHLPAYSWGGGKQIQPGAYQKALSDGREVRLLIEHDAAQLVLSTSKGLELWEDDRGGLCWRARIRDTAKGRQALRGVSNKQYTGFSHGGTRQTVERERYITEFDLVEISLHSRPSFPAAAVSCDFGKTPSWGPSSNC